MKDIQRLEEMVAAEVVDEGIFTFLTSDKYYHSYSIKEMTTVDQKFRIHEGKMISGQLFWDEPAGKGTMKGREEPILLQGKYRMKWDIYSQLDDSIRSEFVYLMLPVHKSVFLYR